MLQCLKDGTFIAKSFQNNERKSEIWKTFSLIVNKDGISQNFVQCIKCRSIFKYNSSKTGNSHLKRHTCAALIKGSSEGSSNLKQTNLCASLLKKTNVNIKELVIKKCVYMCAEDMRSFEIVSGSGFKSFCQFLLKVGAEQQGVFDVNDLLPHPTTISRHLKIESANKRLEILPEIREYIQNGICSATTDMWTDD